MTDASELYDIGHIIPARPTSQIAGELARLMKGSLGDLRANREPQQFQSQFWLGTILHRGGYLPTVPPDKGTLAPDYLIEEGTMTYGMEAKRPDSSESGVAAIYDAARQLRDYGVRGAALVDVSVVADIHQLIWVRREEAYAASQSFKSRFRTATRQIGQTVNRAYNTSGSVLQNLLVLFFHARTYSWIEGEPSGLARVLIPHVAAWIKPLKNLEYHHTMNIQAKLIIGLQKVGYPFEPLSEIAATPQGFPRNRKL
jgi:hypothetical protein